MAEPLKNMVDQKVVEELAHRFHESAPSFDATAFIEMVMADLPDLELKPRIEAIARRIRAGLDSDYRSALAVVIDVARSEPPLDGFAAWPLCSFVEIYGVDDPDVSLAAMEHLTKRASCEFAVRPFLRDHFDESYTVLEAFTSNGDEAVRRLPSEGMRPRLPWGMRVARLVDDPAPGILLLERLRHDPSETVRRSVANHLNDVAKEHPELVVSIAKRWLAEDPAVEHKTVAHALRTLVKRGDTGALEALGFTTDPSIEVVSFTVAPTSVGMGGRIELAAEVHSTASTPQRLVVDFVIHHVTARGETSPKVFKWTTLDLAPGSSANVTKRRLIQHGSTRTYYAGEHTADLLVAGRCVASASFEVVV